MVNEVDARESLSPRPENEARCSAIELRISPDRIHFLKFILEGYDGLAILSTLDARQGLVRIVYPPGMQKDLAGLLHEVSPAIIK